MVKKPSERIREICAQVVTERLNPAGHPALDPMGPPTQDQLDAASPFALVRFLDEQHEERDWP